MQGEDTGLYSSMFCKSFQPGFSPKRCVKKAYVRKINTGWHVEVTHSLTFEKEDEFILRRIVS